MPAALTCDVPGHTSNGVRSVVNNQSTAAEQQLMLAIKNTRVCVELCCVEYSTTYRSKSYNAHPLVRPIPIHLRHWRAALADRNHMRTHENKYDLKRGAKLWSMRYEGNHVWVHTLIFYLSRSQRLLRRHCAIHIYTHKFRPYAKSPARATRTRCGVSVCGMINCAWMRYMFVNTLLVMCPERAPRRRGELARSLCCFKIRPTDK